MLQQEYDTNATNLLISILLRFPEIISLHLDMPNKSASFTFMLSNRIKKEEFIAFKTVLKEYLSAYKELTGINIAVKANLQHAGKVSLLVLATATDYLTLESIQLICGTVCNIFTEKVIRETVAGVFTHEEEIARQEEIIDYLLSHSKEARQENLVAFRESGKVFVYGK